jgi:type IV secretory pathway TrbF-like protein
MPSSSNNGSLSAPLDTPFTLARQYRAEELGAMAAQRTWWQGMCLALLGLLMLALGIIAYQVMLRQRTPIKVLYVEVNGPDVRLVGPAPDHYAPQYPALAAVMRMFVKVLRRVSTDKVLMAQDWLDIYSYVTPAGHKALDRYVTTTQPLLRKDPVTVEVQRVLPRTATTYDIRWVEQVVTTRGEVGEPQTYSGLFTFKHVEPTREDVARKNPLGIYLDTWSFDKE